MTCNFTSFLTVFQSYQDDNWVIVKGCIQWNPLYSEKDLCLQWVSNPGQNLMYCATRDSGDSLKSSFLITVYIAAIQTTILCTNLQAPKHSVLIFINCNELCLQCLQINYSYQVKRAIDHMLISEDLNHSLCRLTLTSVCAFCYKDSSDAIDEVIFQKTYQVVLI